MSFRHIIFLVVVLVAFGYFLFEARGVLLYPPLYVFEPHNNEVFHTTRIHVAGSTDPDSHVLVNGRDFIADPNGNFDGLVTVNPGYNPIGFSVRDRFGHETQKVLQIVIE